MPSLPQYLMGLQGQLDFEPINQGLGRYFQQQQLQRENEFKQRQMGMEEQRLGFEGERLGFDRAAATRAQELFPLQKDQMRAHTGLYGAQAYQARKHGDFYTAASQAALQKADTSADRAHTERIKMLGETYDRLSRAQTPEAWDRENGPGGIIPARFGGPVPFERRGEILRQVQDRRSAAPDEIEMMDLGFTPGEIRNMKRQRVMDAYKMPKDTAAERNSEIIAKTGLKNLDDAEKLLNDASLFGRIAGDRWTIPGTKTQVGGFGDAGRGFKAAEMALTELNFALSGKSVSNAEREAFARLYMPSSADSKEMRDFKLGKVRQYFNTVLAARKKGASDEQIGEMYRGFLQPETAPAPQQRGGIDRDALTREAEDAIARGAPRDKVMQRLQEKLRGAR